MLTAGTARSGLLSGEGVSICVPVVTDRSAAAEVARSREASEPAKGCRIWLIRAAPDVPYARRDGEGSKSSEFRGLVKPKQK